MSQRTLLRIAAALAGTSIACAAHGGGNQPLAGTTVFHSEFQFASTSPQLSMGFAFDASLGTNYLSMGVVTSSADPSLFVSAWSGGGEDRLRYDYFTGQEPGFLPPGLASGEIMWEVVFSNPMALSTMVADLPGTWMADDGSGDFSISVGDVFVAGTTYVFTWTLGSPMNLAGDGAHYDFDLGFIAATAPVPLPGAAAIAAIGLLGGTGRRRR